MNRQGTHPRLGRRTTALLPCFQLPSESTRKRVRSYSFSRIDWLSTIQKHPRTNEWRMNYNPENIQKTCTCIDVKVKLTNVQIRSSTFFQRRIRNRISRIFLNKTTTCRSLNTSLCTGAISLISKICSSSRCPLSTASLGCRFSRPR